MTSPLAQGRTNRRHLLGLLGAGAAMTWASTRAQNDEATAEATPPVIQSSSAGEMPTYGGARSGPVGTRPVQASSAGRSIPTSISVEKAQIEATIEQLEIVNGTMENPTGPWVVSWYKETAELGEIGNVVLAGHVDYWNVGPAVFYNVRNLVAGDEIVLTGANQKQYTYAVISNDTYGIDDLISGLMTDLVAPTETQVLTMITCGGEFDYENGEYLSRTVVRAEIKPTESTPPA